MKALQFTVLRVFFVLTLFINSINPSSAATTQDTSVFDHYLKIQTSLAADDLESVKNASQTLATEIAKAPTKSLTASARKKLTPEVKALLASKDLESARKAFKPLSATLIDLNEAAKIAELKVAYCPMAKAKWLQKGTEIKNPYYGKSMLECGEIQEAQESQKPNGAKPAK